MHQDVHAAAGRLVGGQGGGELRVHDGEAGTADVVVVAPLDAALVFGDDAAVAHLAACGGDGEHHAHRQAGLGPAGPVVELPHVGLLRQAIGDGFGGVDDAAASHGQNEVYTLLPAQLNAAVHQRQPGVGHHAAQLGVGDLRLIQRGLDPHQQPGPDHAAAAVVNQHFFAALGLDQRAGLLLRALAEHHLGGGVIDEIEHKLSSCIFVGPSIPPKRSGHKEFSALPKRGRFDIIRGQWQFP